MASSEVSSIDSIVDLSHYPLHQAESTAYRTLVESCRDVLRTEGVLDLNGFMREEALSAALVGLRPLIDHASFEHRREHNIYFLPEVPGLDSSHPALRRMETSNRTVCADQLLDSVLNSLYVWPPLRQFLARVIDVPELHLMDDELAAVNVMSYRDGEALNWHFDRAEFTTTLLLQRPRAGGIFEYRSNVRTNDEPNHDAVGRLVDGLDDEVRQRDANPGTLTVFAGHNTAHRVTPTRGEHERVIAVFSFYEQPHVRFSAAERIGFYGRAGVLG